MEYFLGSLWCGCGEWWRCLVFTGAREQRGKNADPGDLSLTDFITQQRVTVTRESEQTWPEMRWCTLMHFKSYSQIKCDYILQDILLFSLAIVQCPRVKSFHINCCLQCSFIYPNTVTSLMFDTFRKYIVKQNQTEYSGIWQVCKPRTRGSYTWRQQVRELKRRIF